MTTRASRSLLICAIRAMALVSVVLFLILPARAQQSQNWDWCNDRGGSALSLDRRISACSAIIESISETPEELARAYGNRGVAYQNKEDNDRAAHD
jgi:tetratricopeptide (TPR) repeat protein